MLSVELSYHNGHRIYWDSQPKLKRKPIGDLLFTDDAFINILASDMFNEKWEAKSRRQIKMLTAKEVVNQASDEHCDSPGHSAKYGTYTLMDDDTGNAVTVDDSQVS